jgi:Signal transducing histidine kinase, homodimeric domain
MTEITAVKTQEPKDIGDRKKASIKVNVGLLDTLMTLAGELVLSRNQLMQGLSTDNVSATEISSQRIDMITSELQETIMGTRMQPMANVLNKLSRVVRDLSQELGKSIDLVIEGRDVQAFKAKEHQEIIVFRIDNRELGLMVMPPLDTVEVSLNLDDSSLKQPGISGSMIIKDHTTLIVDVPGLVRAIKPEWVRSNMESTKVDSQHKEN